MYFIESLSNALEFSKLKQHAVVISVQQLFVALQTPANVANQSLFANAKNRQSVLRNYIRRTLL